MEKRYARAYTEVLEILKHIPEEEYKMIPSADIRFYESNCDKNYNFVYDINKEIKEQNISKEANAVIVSIYMNYFANERQKTIINEILKQNTIENEKEKQKKYDTNNIFKKNNDDDIVDRLPIVVDEKKQNIFTKFFYRLRKLFTRA